MSGSNIMIENQCNKLFTQKYGKDFYKRIEKLTEEYNEFIEAVEATKKDHTGYRKIIDELSDMQAVMCHIANILNITVEELLLMAYTKVKIREHNPNYLKDGKK